MITVKDFLEKITNPDRIKIVKGEEVLFTGYKGALVHEGAADLSPDILEAEMVSFRIDPEIRAKDWKARGLMAPIEPEQAPDYKFSDLEMKLYYKICILEGENMKSIIGWAMLAGLLFTTAIAIIALVVLTIMNIAEWLKMRK